MDKDELQRDLHCYHSTLKLSFRLCHRLPGSFYRIIWDSRGLERIRGGKDNKVHMLIPQRRALNALKHSQDIVRKPADKDSKIVI